MDVRTATLDELAAVLNVLDGAMLETDASSLETKLDEGDVLVAVEPNDEAHTDRLLGALVLDQNEIVAVAVRTRRRGQGIGTALVEDAIDRRGRLVAEFDERVRPFWESVGFAIEPVGKGEDRFLAWLEE